MGGVAGSGAGGDSGGGGKSCASLIEVQMGDVEVFAVSRALGDAMPNVEIQVDGDRTVRRSPLRLPYGKHRLRIHVQGFAGVDREIDLRQSRLTVRATLEVGMLYGTCDDTVGPVGGEISGGDGELWVRAVPVVGVGSLESPVEGGYFLLEGLDVADHVLLVLRGHTVLHQQVVRPGLKRTNVRIDLAAKC